MPIAIGFDGAFAAFEDGMAGVIAHGDVEDGETAFLGLAFGGGMETTAFDGGFPTVIIGGGEFLDGAVEIVLGGVSGDDGGGGE